MNIKFPILNSHNNRIFSNPFKILSQLDRKMQIAAGGIIAVLGIGLLIGLYRKFNRGISSNQITSTPKDSTKTQTTDSKNETKTKSCELLKCLENENDEKLIEAIDSATEKELASLYENADNKTIIEEAFSRYFRLQFETISKTENCNDIKFFIDHHFFAENDEELKQRKIIVNAIRKMPFKVDSHNLSDIKNGLLFCEKYYCIATTIGENYAEPLDIDPKTDEALIFTWVKSKNTKFMHEKIKCFAESLLSRVDKNNIFVLEYLIEFHKETFVSSYSGSFNPELFAEKIDLCKLLSTIPTLVKCFKPNSDYLIKHKESVLNLLWTTDDEKIKQSIRVYIMKCGFFLTKNQSFEGFKTTNEKLLKRFEDKNTGSEGLTKEDLQFLENMPLQEWSNTIDNINQSHVDQWGEQRNSNLTVMHLNEKIKRAIKVSSIGDNFTNLKAFANSLNQQGDSVDDFPV